MAAALVENSETPHTLEHDLESAFWVLIWAVVSYMPTSMGDEERSNFLKDTMSPKVYRKRSGSDKRKYLVAREVPRVKSHLYIHHLLQQLILLFTAQYPVELAKPPASTDIDSIIKEATGIEAPTKGNTEDKARDEYLRGNLNHQVILLAFKRFLESPGWPERDGANAQPKILSQDEKHGMLAGSAQSRSCTEEIGVLVHPSTT